MLSVNYQPRKVIIGLLPKECYILCTHPMFGPDSRNNLWRGFNFVYERNHIDGVFFGPINKRYHQMTETYADSYDGKEK